MNDAGTPQEKAKDAAGKAQATVREQVEQRTKQAGERVSGTAGDLRSVGEELRKQGKDTPAKVADRAAEQTERVGSYLSGTGPDKMLHDIEDFGRKRPWAVMAGGLVVGAVAARFLKASSRDRYRQRGSFGEAPTRELGGPTAPEAPAATPPSTPEPVASPIPGP